ncbi:DNA repair exonuclease [Clostridium sp. MSJ-11]|uniref:DNA repair exonuclease n=1 Tax=Clostridium mobile TaxID=2841512 RepID=A0ABS6EJA6_9CLOT|nr:DNA repair exonuclease [Clostridium mobile]MBU5484867.1 DNA repair exonuclease [Clostridium mobile]
MNRSFKFIHAADMHLGNIMNISEEANNSFNNNIFESFKYLCNYAKNNNVDFILISGDLFHSKGRDIRVDKFFYDQCKNISPIKIYVICGNHDPMKNRNEIFEIPSNLIFFKSNAPQVEEVYKDGNIICRIIGQSYQNSFEKKKIHQGYEEFLEKDETFKIGFLHTQLGDDNYIPCTIGELKEIKSIDYWALGHIHRAQVLNIEKPFIGYPGVPQGCDFGERGSGGFYLTEVREEKISNVKFIHCSSIIWERINLNIDVNNTPNNIEELEDLMIKVGEDFLGRYNSNLKLGIEEENEIENKIFIIRWIIEGRGEGHNLVREKEEFFISYLKESLNKRLFYSGFPIWTEEISINTKPSLDYNLLEKNSFYEEIKKIYELCLSDDEIKKDIMKSLGKIWTQGDEEFINDYQFPLYEEDYIELIKSSLNLIEEKLLEGSD